MSDENRVVGKPVKDSPQENSSLEKKIDRRSRKKPELDRSEIKLTVGQLIAIKRRELRWSQEELAWQSGVSRTQIGRIERDESDPVVDTIEALERPSAQAFIQNVYVYNKDQIEIEFRIEDEIKKMMACLDRRLNETKELKNG